MKKIKLYCASMLISAMALFASPSVLSMGTLKELAVPYVGYYRCEQLRIGNTELPTDGVRLELSGSGEAIIYWKTALGKEQSRSYQYSYNDAEKTFYISIPIAKEQKIFKVPYQNGEVIFSETLSGKAFFAKFTKK